MTLQTPMTSPVTPLMILGGNDRRPGDDLQARLGRSGTEVIEIAGVNHLFDDEYGFDLVDTVGELRQRPPF